MLVQGGYPVSFTYPTYDQASGLYVAASIYDVTSGTPTLQGSPSAMVDLENGVYAGSFTPVQGHAYLVIALVYLDAGFTTLDTTRAPWAENYDAFTSNTAQLNFNYGSYDQESDLTVIATVYDLTDSTSSSFTMAYVAGGVYFGQYAGTVGKSYAVVMAPTDTTLAPVSASFQAFAFPVEIFDTYLVNAALAGQAVSTTLTTQAIAAALSGQALATTLAGQALGTALQGQTLQALLEETL